MCETTLAFLDDNNGLWSGIVAFAAAVTDAKAGVTAIRDEAGSQGTPTSGITEAKAQVRNDLEDQTLEIGDQVAALAAKNKDPKLAAEVHVTRSSLDQMEDSNLVETAKRVRDAANNNIAALADYGVTAAKVTALTNAINAFADMKTAPREAAAGKKGKTGTLAEMIRTTRSLFRNQIDKMMTPFRKTNPDFYGGYFAARVIVDVAASHAAPKKPTPP
jgi:hypothetical protein